MRSRTFGPAPRLRRILAAGVLAGACAAAPAGACPACATGREARRAVYQQGFGFNMGVALLPFLLIGAVCARAEAIGRSPAPTRRRPSPTSRWAATPDPGPGEAQ